MNENAIMEETFPVRSVPGLVVQLRVTVWRSEKLVAETMESSGTQKKGDFHRWNPLQSNG
jgi:hypothetical protein